MREWIKYFFEDVFDDFGLYFCVGLMFVAVTILAAKISKIFNMNIVLTVIILISCIIIIPIVVGIIGYLIISFIDKILE